MQIFIATDYLIMMSEKNLYLIKRKKHLPWTIFALGSNWIHALWKDFLIMRLPKICTKTLRRKIDM